MTVTLNIIQAGDITPRKIIDNAVSIIWVQRYNEAGEFEIQLQADKETFNLLVNNECYLTRDDSASVMICEDIKLTTDAENGDIITITGRSAESILARRIANHLYEYSDVNAEALIRYLVTSTIGANTSEERRVDLVTMGGTSGLTDMIDHIQILGDNILDKISELAKTYNYGFAVRYNRSISKLVFGVYVGVDRTYEQNTVNAVVFSPDYNNLASSEYEKNRQNTANFAYVSGERISGTQTIIPTPTDNPPTGLNRRETWIDASSKTQASSVSTSAYERILANYGQENLSTMKEVVTFMGEVGYSTQSRYGVDYTLGDKVQVNNGYGVNMAAYVTEVTEVQDAGGYFVHPTLSNWETT